MLASLPVILPEDLLPDWIEGPLVMWITIAGTTVMAVTAALNPVWSVLGVAAVVVGQVKQAHLQRWRLMEGGGGATFESGDDGQGQGPRYCPSLESKYRRFPGRTHQVRL